MTAVDPRRYYGSIPEIAKAYENDPRTKLAASALMQGTNTAPVAQGGWAVTDGLARAAQAIAGAFVQKSQDKKYAKREGDYTEAMRAAAALAGTPQPQPQPLAPNPAMANPASGTAPPIETFDPSGPAAALTPPDQLPPAGAPGAFQAAFGAPVGQPPAPARLAATTPVSGPSANPIRGGSGPDNRSAGFVHPLGGKGTPTSGYGARRSTGRHNGQDWAAEAGTPVMAASDGVVLRSRTDRRNGNYVRIRHADGSITGYAHLNAPSPLAEGQQVTAGTPIGGVGSTGRSTGNHLHFTVTGPDGRKVDPNKIQYTESASQSYTTNEDVAGVPRVPIAAPEMEEVPGTPAAPTDAQRPGMPALPDEVQTNRIAMARQLLDSGNPDLVAIATQYLEKGLDEQFEARRIRADQQYGRENIGYQSELIEYNDARSQGRQFGYDSNRDAKQRNFQRGQTYSDQTFQAGENAATRDQQARLASADRAHQSSEAELQRTWGSSEADKERSAAGVGKKNPYLDTAAGLKMYETTMAENGKLDKSIAMADRALDLLDKQSTGGVTGAISGVTGAFDEEVSQLRSIFNDQTLQEIGGSLGVAISDGDRKFVTDIGPSMTSSTAGNRAKLTVLRQALIRKRDYNSNRIYALSEGQMALPQFDKLWRQFIDANPLVTYKQGKPQYGRNPQRFEQWIKSRPTFDAAGNRTN